MGIRAHNNDICQAPTPWLAVSSHYWQHYSFTNNWFIKLNVSCAQIFPQTKSTLVHAYSDPRLLTLAKMITTHLLSLQVKVVSTAIFPAWTTAPSCLPLDPFMLCMLFLYLLLFVIFYYWKNTHVGRLVEYLDCQFTCTMFCLFHLYYFLSTLHCICQ